MKSRIPTLFALIFILFSCKEDEELTPSAKLQGKYESSAELPSSWGFTNYIYVNSLEFKSDGTVYGEGTTLNIETEELLGYRYYINGTYTVIDGIVTVKYQDFYSMGIADIEFMEKDKLMAIDDIENGVYAIQEDYTQLNYMCSTFPDCGIMQLYIKVE